MRWVVIVLTCCALSCEPTITDPCPGQRTCPDHVCCDEGLPYHCGNQCFSSPCGAGQLTCVNVDLTDGCYGGVWKGSYNGGEVQFTINSHVISASKPASGTGSIDCDSGVGTFMASGATFRGNWMHTESEGDKIINPTVSNAGSADGTWNAVRIE